MKFLTSLFSSVSISDIQYAISPWTAPVPSAATVGFSLYDALLKLMPWWAAAIIAVIGVAGMETSGGLMFTLAGKAFAKRKFDIMAAAVIGALVYVGIVIGSIGVTNDTRSIVGSVLVTLITYLGISLYEYMRTLERAEAQQAEIRHADDDAEIKKSLARTKELNAAKNLERAKAKAYQAVSGQGMPSTSASTGHPDVSTGQTGQRKPVNLDASKLSAVILFLKSQPSPEKVSVRAIEAQNLGVKHAQASVYKSAALEYLKAEK